MKKIVGLDLGTNSIGWAVISTENNEPKEIQYLVQDVASTVASVPNFEWRVFYQKVKTHAIDQFGIMCA